MSWSLEVFERQVYSGELEGATRSLLDLLNAMNANYGELGEHFHLQPSLGVEGHALEEHAIVRLCAAITTLFAHPQFSLSPVGLAQTLNWHRWISSIFGASDFINMDHLLRSMNIAKVPDVWQIPQSKWHQFVILYSPDSGVPVDLNSLFEINSNVTVGLCLALLSPRFLGTTGAHEKRETLLPWLTQKLLYIDSLEQLPTGILHDVYMHCSYAQTPARHDIKKPINRLIRKSLRDAGLGCVPIDRPIKAKQKPVMLVVLEWFSKGHSIYRTHSKTMAGARDVFEVVAIAYPSAIDEVGRSIFDRVIDLDQSLSLMDQMRFIEKVAQQEYAQVLYMPSVGMFPLTLFLSNLRVCPIQAMALGHPATTHSKEIDYVVVEEDYVGNPQCFSEELLILPKDGMPYRPSELLEDITPLYLDKDKNAVVDIVVCATTMKLNPDFLQTCASIAQRSKISVKFHFLVGQAVGMVFPAVKRFIGQFLGDYAKVYAHQSYKSYIDIIAKSDLFLNPFPFGNTNGIIDTVSAGLVGVCKTGDEVFEHIDEGLFKRLQMPGWMIASTNEEYIEAALRLIENPKERMVLRKSLTGKLAIAALFNGRPHIMGEMLYEKYLDKTFAKDVSQNLAATNLMGDDSSDTS